MTRQFVQAAYSGLVLGAIYATMAMGLTLIWGSIRILNLAHGAFFTIGAYAAFSVVVIFGLPVGLGPVVGALGGALSGALVYLLALRPLMGKAGWGQSTLVAGLGVAIVVEASLILVFGGREKAMPSLLEGIIRLPGGVAATAQGVLIALVGVATLLGLAAYLTRARHGIAIRATASDARAAHLVGINVGRVILAVFILGSGLAGLAGVMLTSFFFVSPFGGFNALVKGLIVTIAGGLGNLRGTVAAAFLVGLVESSVSTFMGVRWSLPILFGAIALLLAVRPTGLAGKLAFEGSE